MASRWRIPAVAVLVAGTVLLAWLFRPAAKPSVLLISIDALRTDYVSCYAGSHGETPHIDAVAAAGVTFTQAIADAPWERASMASVLTGCSAATHRVRSLFDRLPAAGTTMAEAFAAAGYRTGAVVSEFDLDHVFGLDRGFQTYDDRYTLSLHDTGDPRPVHLASIFYGDLARDRSFRQRKLRADSIRDDPEVTAAAMGWIRHVGGQPFFLWVHYIGPQTRWKSGAGIDEAIADYQPAVQRVDAEVGRLLRWLNQMQLDRNTIIVLLADRGAGLLDRGSFAPGRELYDASVHVPLIMYWRGRLPAGGRSGALVSLVDVLPTLTELSGIAPPARLDGHSLVGLLHGAAPAPSAEAYCETYLPATAAASQTIRGADGGVVHFGVVRRAVRTARWKYIRTDPSPLIDVPAPDPAPESLPQSMASEELYDLSQDPAERRNLVDSQPETAQRLRIALAHYAVGKQPGKRNEGMTARPSPR